MFRGVSLLFSASFQVISVCWKCCGDATDKYAATAICMAILIASLEITVRKHFSRYLTPCFCMFIKIAFTSKMEIVT